MMVWLCAFAKAYLIGAVVVTVLALATGWLQTWREEKWREDMSRQSGGQKGGIRKLLYTRENGIAAMRVLREDNSLEESAWLASTPQKTDGKGADVCATCPKRTLRRA